MNIGRSDTYWRQLVSTRVIGHRGLAASLGASYVEFDVQLTKDFIPVVYHDFTVAESGVDIPMHALTAEQFLGLSDQEHNSNKDKIRFEKQKSLNKTFKTNYSLDDEMLGKINRPRSMSSYPSAPDFKPNDGTNNQIEDDLDREFKDQISSRMKLTKTWKDKGFKGNARGLSIASNFVTLKELFKKLPKNVGFNIELKYPMLDEAEMESMGEIAIDLNFYVDTILKVVYDENITGRDIIFSSFHPDICLLLSLKQPTIPILFLSEAGSEKMADIRASSLQNAIRFAKKWNLLGIVSAAKTLVICPRLAQVVKSSGLVCVTYGVENNSPELAKIQMKAGVDAVIADSVLAVREGLRKDQPSAKEIENFNI
ncbi:Glycerophosphocholine phosphodiesterase [Cerrena zonata]|uniref:Glycerophosphocholine phosphodiesterase n=1 Tax=Cerrena zonata TaxID=2478898 RepID=A0AAW0FJH0_9APHY